MVMYINHIIWRFVEHKPDQYRMLDVRHDVMKNLILGDCDDLIKFILFGNKNDNKFVEDGNDKGDKDKVKKYEEFEIKHIPRSKFWKKKHKYIKDDDIDFFDNEKISNGNKPKNDMELAIFHCRRKIQYFQFYFIALFIIY